MATEVEKSIEVNVPVRVAYDQWTQFEEFPQFMSGVAEVTQLDDRRLHWVAEIAGVRREWDAEILEQTPDSKVAWAATSGATNAGAVHFTPLQAGRTLVRLRVEYEPLGLVEAVGDKLNAVERQVEADLQKFKTFIERRGTETGAWRGSVNDAGSVGTPDVEDAVETPAATEPDDYVTAPASAPAATTTTTTQLPESSDTATSIADETGSVGAAAAAAGLGVMGTVGGVRATGAAAGSDLGYGTVADNSDLEIRDTTDRGGAGDAVEAVSQGELSPPARDDAYDAPDQPGA